MPLDLESANIQIVRMARQAASARYAADRLSAYRRRLQAAWSGEEAQMYDRAAAELSRQCEALERQMTVLRGEIVLAVEEIAEEEALALL